MDCFGLDDFVAPEIRMRALRLRSVTHAISSAREVDSADQSRNPINVHFTNVCSTPVDRRIEWNALTMFCEGYCVLVFTAYVRWQRVARDWRNDGLNQEYPRYHSGDPIKSYLWVRKRRAVWFKGDWIRYQRVRVRRVEVGAIDLSRGASPPTQSFCSRWSQHAAYPLLLPLPSRCFTRRKAEKCARVPDTYQALAESDSAA